MVNDYRIKILNNKEFQNNKYIIYWMQQSQRTKYNHALEYGIEKANKYNKPLIVFFGLTDFFPDANIRHYNFMIEGLKEVKDNLNELGINLVVKHISPDKGIIDFSSDACMVVVDRGYLRIQRKWRDIVSKKIKCPLIQIESDIVVPVEQATNKEEYAARTIRPKINNKKQNFLNEIIDEIPIISSVDMDFDSLDVSNVKNVLNILKVDRDVKISSRFKGGSSQAEKLLDDFLKNKIDKYEDYKNDPNKNYVSDLSPYLHFGQISPVYISLKCLKKRSPVVDSFLEELIVRRELAINYVYYNRDYDSYKGIPSWAKKTLKKHLNDKREYIYNLEDFENAETHNPFWNKSQKQMIKTGKMHGYMRMFWGKKVLEWTKKPQDAFKILIYLNNKYELDGRDPNGYTGIAWCFGKHDRPWAERDIFGNIRYMNSNGLKRKFDTELFLK